VRKFKSDFQKSSSNQQRSIFWKKIEQLMNIRFPEREFDSEQLKKKYSNVKKEYRDMCTARTETGNSENLYTPQYSDILLKFFSDKNGLGDVSFGDSLIGSSNFLNSDEISGSDVPMTDINETLSENVDEISISNSVRKKRKDIKIGDGLVALGNSIQDGLNSFTHLLQNPQNLNARFDLVLEEIKKSNENILKTIREGNDIQRHFNCSLIEELKKIYDK
jgi:hypothetical protein